MKELTEKEKAQRYDEAIEKFDVILNLNTVKESGTISTDDVRKILPELAESKDERIRMSLIELFKDMEWDDSILHDYNMDKDKTIAWLEKQKVLTTEENLQGKKDVLWCIEQAKKHAKDENEMGTCCLLKNGLKKQGNLMKALQISNARIGELIEENYYLREQLEKQGENNMGISEATKQELEDTLNKALEKETPESWNKFLDEQGEQKPAKVEPKFNVGDKIQYSKGCGTIMTIEKIENGEYIFGNNMGHTTIESGNKWHLVEQKPTNKIVPKFKVGDYVVGKYISGYISEVRDDCYLLDYQGFPIDKQDNYHLWTIQDAKDGDVLHSPSYRLVWIYKDNEHYHACVNMNYVTENTDRNGQIVIPNDVCPATKDKQTILFAKLKDAGYEWDADKKELDYITI